jgi:hypothetical protein
MIDPFRGAVLGFAPSDIHIDRWENALLEKEAETSKNFSKTGKRSSFSEKELLQASQGFFFGEATSIPDSPFLSA